MDTKGRTETIHGKAGRLVEKPQLQREVSVLKWEGVLEGSQHRKKEPGSIHIQLHAPCLIHRIEQEKLFLKMFLNALEKSTGSPTVSILNACCQKPCDGFLETVLRNISCSEKAGKIFGCLEKRDPHGLRFLVWFLDGTCQGWDTVQTVEWLSGVFKALSFFLGTMGRAGMLQVKWQPIGFAELPGIGIG